MRHGVTFDYVEEVSEPSYAPLIGKADALVIRTQPLIGGDDRKRRQAEDRLAPRRRIRLRGHAALNARRIPLCIVGDTNSVSVAEHAMMMILACAKQAIRADRAVRSGNWGWRNRLEAGEISGKRLLIVGFGRAGRHLARMARGFEMEVRAFDPFLAEKGWPEGAVQPVASLSDGLAWADVISVNVPKAGQPLLTSPRVHANETGRHPRQHGAWRHRR